MFQSQILKSRDLEWHYNQMSPTTHRHPPLNFSNQILKRFWLFITSRHCHNTVTTLLQHCYNTVTTLSQQCHNTVITQHCCNTVTTMSQHCHNNVTKLSQLCHNSILTLLLIVKVSRCQGKLRCQIVKKSRSPGSRSQGIRVKESEVQGA